MKNAYLITDLAGMMAKSCDTIGAISLGINNTEQNGPDAVIETYKLILGNELENLQHSVLALTQAVTDAIGGTETRGDDAGSVFMQGELNDDLGKKDHPDGVAVDYVDPDEEEK